MLGLLYDSFKFFFFPSPLMYVVIFVKAIQVLCICISPNNYGYFVSLLFFF